MKLHNWKCVKSVSGLRKILVSLERGCLPGCLADELSTWDKIKWKNDYSKWKYKSNTVNTERIWKKHMPILVTRFVNLFQQQTDNVLMINEMEVTGW